MALDRLLQTAEQAREYERGTLFQAWLIETDVCHPSIASSMPYWESYVEDLQVHLAHEARDTGSEVIAAVVVAAMDSLSTYSAVLPDEGFGPDLERWGSRLTELLKSLRQENASSVPVSDDSGVQ